STPVRPSWKKPVPDAPNWLPSPVSTFAVGKGPALALDRDRLAVRELEPVVAAVFGRCQGVRPLQDHIAQAWTAGVSPSPTAIADAIDLLVTEGLLRPLVGRDGGHETSETLWPRSGGADS